MPRTAGTSSHKIGEVLSEVAWNNADVNQCLRKLVGITHIYKDVSRLCLHVFVLRFLALLIAVSQPFPDFRIPPYCL